MTAPSDVRPDKGVRPGKPSLEWRWPAMPDSLAGLAGQTGLAARRMWRNRSITVLVVLSLAIGVGANTAVFSLVDALFLEPVPFADPRSLVTVGTTDARNPGPLAFSVPNFRDLRAAAKSFDSLVACLGLHVNLGEAGSVVETAAELVTPNYFRTLGISAYVGTVFSPAALAEPHKAGQEEDEQDEKSQRIAVISHALWLDRFGGDPAIVGRNVRINQLPFEVVGVMPESFRGTERLYGTEIWIPFANYSLLAERPTWEHSRRALIANSFGRLKPGVTLAQARLEADSVGQRLAARYPGTNAGRSFELSPLADMQLGHERRGKLMTGAAVALFAAGLVLLVGIANASSVLLAHAAGRQREMALRLALGATRRHFFSQIVLESLLLVAAGGAIGLLIGVAGREILWSLRPEEISARDITLSLNPRVLAFSIGLSLIAGVIANLLPVMQALRAHLFAETRAESTRSGRFTPLRQFCRRMQCRHVLVVGQVALSLVALVGAELFLRGHRKVQQLDPGFDTGTLALAEVNPRRLGVPPLEQMEFHEKLIERIERIPGVQSAAAASDPVFGFHGLLRTVRVDDARPARFVVVTSVTARYFETTDILILRGRSFTSSEMGGEQLVAVVNEAMARSYWGSDESPLGKHFRLFGDPEDRVVIGVARNTAFADLGNADTPLVYVPMGQDGANATVHIRTKFDPALLSAKIASEIRAAEPNHPAPAVKTISGVMERALWIPRMAAGLLTAFGLMALTLAAIGVYGLTSHLVAHRTGEIGLRMAMGASPVDVKQLVLRHALTLILPGLLIGAAAAAAVERLARGAMLPIPETAVEPYLAASVLLAISALAASYLPARRAVKMLPAAALRQH